jgi:hypothetical protein
MKKVLFLFAAVLFFASCEGPMGPPGRPGQDAVVFSRTIEVRNWIDEGPFFTASISVPQLTRDIFDNGAIIIYHEWQENGAWVARPLPFALQVLDGNGDIWTEEQWDFEFWVGGVMIYYTVSDLFFEGSPGRQNFRIVLLR